jgi:integrase
MHIHCKRYCTRNGIRDSITVSTGFCVWVAQKGPCAAEGERGKREWAQGVVESYVVFRLLSFQFAYATHLLEASVHLRVIQALLGHKSVSTTFLYMHLTQATMEGVQAKINDIMRHD